MRREADGLASVTTALGFKIRTSYLAITHCSFSNAVSNEVSDDDPNVQFTRVPTINDVYKKTRSISNRQKEAILMISMVKHVD